MLFRSISLSPSLSHALSLSLFLLIRSLFFSASLPLSFSFYLTDSLSLPRSHYLPLSSSLSFCCFLLVMYFLEGCWVLSCPPRSLSEGNRWSNAGLGIALQNNQEAEKLRREAKSPAPTRERHRLARLKPHLLGPFSSSQTNTLTHTGGCSAILVLDRKSVV